MIKITPLMTSLHEGHKAEERIKCIDNMLFNKCEDTKNNILKAFWWYRKNSIPLGRIKQLKEEMYEAAHADGDGCETVINLEDAFEILDKLITESEVNNG